MKRAVLSAMMILVAALAVFASPLKVTWVDGTVEKKSGLKWLAINIGDIVDSTDTVRLGPNSSAEFADGAKKVALAAPGTYSLEIIIRKGAEAAKKTIGALDKLGKLVDPKASASTQTTVGAVRADAKNGEADVISWQGEDVDVKAVMEEGRALVRSGQFSQAVDKFSLAASNAEGEEKNSAYYAKAWTLAANGDPMQSMLTLKLMSDKGIWAGPKALLLARLEIDAGAKSDAAALLKAALAAKLLAGDDIVQANAMLSEALAP